MAYVDFIANGPEHCYTHLPPAYTRPELGVPAPPQQQPAPIRQPPAMLPFRPAGVCHRCYSQYNPGFSLNGLCPNCTPHQRPLPPPIAPVNGSVISAPPPISLQQQQQQQHQPEFVADVNVDRFMMSNMLHVVNDVLKEQDDGGGLKLNGAFDDASSSGVTLGSTSSDLTTASVPKVNACSKCGVSPHTAFCIQCQEFLCSNCILMHVQVFQSHDHHMISTPSSLSHSGSRKTSPPSSTLLPSPVGDQLPVFGDNDYESCEKHADEKLAFFCQICVTVVCKSCLVSDHSHHNCLALREAYMRFKPAVEELLGKTQVEINMLDISFDAAEKMTESVSVKKADAVSEVHKIFQTHREALVQRELEVAAQVNAIADLRLDSLSKEKENISACLKSLKSLSLNAEKTLRDANKGEMLVSHFLLSEKLRNGHSPAYGRNPVEDDSFVLKSNTLAAQGALKNLCLLTTAPYPPLCSAMGEGLYHPRVNRLCTVILCTKDRAGEACLEGGERLFVQIRSILAGNAGTPLPIDIRDNQDGTYSINFRARTKGEHQLVIAIRGQHIQGSPFTVVVDGGREYGRFGVVSHLFGTEGTQSSQFCRPWGICCDQQGHIVIGDRSNHRIQVFDSNGVFKHSFGTEGVRPGQFNRPAGVAVSREGHIVVADKDNHRIQVLKIDGSFLFMFGSKGGNDGQMIYPYDVAVNQLDGRIAVTDTGNHRLLIFSHEGILLGKFGYKGYLCGHFDSPRGIAYNDDGYIIVSDFNVHHILVIHPDGTTARILGSQGSGNGQFMRPQGIAVDHMGNFIIADTRNNRVVIMHPSGHFIAKFGTPGQGPGQFDRPTNVAVLPDGRIAVVDFGNSRIQIF